MLRNNKALVPNNRIGMGPTYVLQNLQVYKNVYEKTGKVILGQFYYMRSYFLLKVYTKFVLRGKLNFVYTGLISLLDERGRPSDVIQLVF